MIGDSFLPLLGQPSLSRDEIISLYIKYGITDYTESDIASDLENANKYSAVGIEGQIAKRASNVPGSGYAPVPTIAVIRSQAPTPVSPTVVGNVVAVGPTAATTSYVGPTGPIVAVQGQAVNGPVSYAPGALAAVPASAGGLFSDPTTLLILAAVAGAAWFLLVRH